MSVTRCLLPLLFAWLSLILGAPAHAEETARPKSAETAAYLSVIGTAFPVGIGVAQAIKSHGDAGAASILFGYMLGPSLGHFYAGRPGAAWGGIGVRVLPLLVLTGATALSWNASESTSSSQTAEVMAWGSLALGVGLTAWDIARTANSVRAHNDELTHPRVSLGAIPVGSELTPAVVVSVGL